MLQAPPRNTNNPNANAMQRNATLRHSEQTMQLAPGH